MCIQLMQQYVKKSNTVTRPFKSLATVRGRDTLNHSNPAKFNVENLLNKYSLNEKKNTLSGFPCLCKYKIQEYSQIKIFKDFHKLCYTSTYSITASVLSNNQTSRRQQEAARPPAIVMVIFMGLKKKN